MKLEQGRISSRELIFAVFCFMQGTMLRSGFIISVTRSDSWAMAITGLLMTLPLVAVYAGLMRRFPGKSLIEIDDIVFGPVLGKVISALYLFFFLSLAALNTRDLSNFVVDYMMPETPLAAVGILFLFGCVYAIRKGIEPLLRLSVVFCILTVAAVAVNSIFILKDVEFTFLKPLFQQPLMKYVQGTVTVTAVPMGEILTFTTIAPMLGKDKKTFKPLSLGLILSAAFLAVIMLRDLVTLGQVGSCRCRPLIRALCELAGILTGWRALRRAAGDLVLFK